MESVEFGKLIRERRKALGLTQERLAMIIGTAERFIGDLEAGKETAQLGKALLAAKAVGLDVVDTLQAASEKKSSGTEDNLSPDVQVNSPRLRP